MKHYRLVKRTAISRRKATMLYRELSRNRFIVISAQYPRLKDSEHKVKKVHECWTRMSASQRKEKWIKLARQGFFDHYQDRSSFQNFPDPVVAQTDADQIKMVKNELPFDLPEYTFMQPDQQFDCSHSLDGSEFALILAQQKGVSKKDQRLQEFQNVQFPNYQDSIQLNQQMQVQVISKIGQNLPENQLQQNFVPQKAVELRRKYDQQFKIQKIEKTPNSKSKDLLQQPKPEFHLVSSYDQPYEAKFVTSKGFYPGEYRPLNEDADFGYNIEQPEQDRFSEDQEGNMRWYVGERLYKCIPADKKSDQPVVCQQQDIKEKKITKERKGKSQLQLTLIQAINTAKNTQKLTYQLARKFIQDKLHKSKIRVGRESITQQRNRKLKVLLKYIKQTRMKTFDFPASQFKDTLKPYALKKNELMFENAYKPETQCRLCTKCKQLVRQKAYKCTQCKSIVHSQCAKKIRLDKACPGCSFPVQITQAYVDSQLQKNPQKIKLTPPPNNIDKDKALRIHIQNLVILKQHLNCEYTVENMCNKNISSYIIHQMNRFIQVSGKDLQIITAHRQQQVYPPLIIQRSTVCDGYGCFASRDIKKGQLVTFYAGSLLNQANIINLKIPDTYTMHLFNGMSTVTQWLISPYKYSSFGPIINFIKGRTNMRTLCVCSQYSIHILMIADCQIKQGEQLSYDYNGRYQLMDCSHYK